MAPTGPTRPPWDKGSGNPRVLYIPPGLPTPTHIRVSPGFDWPDDEPMPTEWPQLPPGPTYDEMLKKRYLDDVDMLNPWWAPPIWGRGVAAFKAFLLSLDGDYGEAGKSALGVLPTPKGTKKVDPTLGAKSKKTLDHAKRNKDQIKGPLDGLIDKEKEIAENPLHVPKKTGRRIQQRMEEEAAEYLRQRRTGNE
jgi:hypothetical protein